MGARERLRARAEDIISPTSGLTTPKYATSTIRDLVNVLDAVEAIHKPKNGVSPRYAPDDWDHEYDPVSWEEYVICQGDRTSWPCSDGKP